MQSRALRRSVCRKLVRFCSDVVNDDEEYCDSSVQTKIAVANRPSRNQSQPWRSPPDRERYGDYRKSCGGTLSENRLGGRRFPESSDVPHEVAANTPCRALIRIRLDGVVQPLALLRGHSVKRNGILFDIFAFALWATNVAFVVFTEREN